MDRPKLGVSWLEFFPPDIWAYIVWYLPGEQLGRLLMTGATLLWQRLKSPHVVKSIIFGQDYIIFKSFPKFLNYFPSLDELLIRSSGDEWSNSLGLTIDSIPSGVRKLRLSGFWGMPKSLFGFGESGTTLNLSKHLPHLETLSLDLDTPDYFWMSHSPQSLTHLSLHCWDGTVELPSSLIHFEAVIVTLASRSFVSKLPPSLESFVVSYSMRGVDLIVPLLPLSIRKLHLGNWPEYSAGAKTPHNVFEQLPKSLTWFTAPRSTETNFIAKPEAISLVPATLTELNIIPDFPCSAWSLLPQQLTRLSFKAPGSLCTVASNYVDKDGVQHEIPTFPFDVLPRQITRLELFFSFDEQYFCGPPAASNLSYFPPNLTHLKISVLQLAPETAKLLPASLTYLKIGNVCERVCQNLPTGLKTLISERALMTPNLIKHLPKSLTFLHLAIPVANSYWFDCNTGERVEPISKLADYSIHEKCLSNNFDWKNSSPLPSTLTYLHLPNANELGDSFLEYQQLPHLLQFSLEQSMYFTDLSISLLPPHLTALDLRSSSMVSSKSFEYLPRSLLELNLNSSESIFDSGIQHLPRTLKYAYLSHAIHLTDVCIPHLPPHLEMLYMSLNSQITPSSFPKFPYSLRSSQRHKPAEFSSWHIHRGVVRQ